MTKDASPPRPANDHGEQRDEVSRLVAALFDDALRKYPDRPNGYEASVRLLLDRVIALSRELGTREIAVATLESRRDALLSMMSHPNGTRTEPTDTETQHIDADPISAIEQPPRLVTIVPVGASIPSDSDEHVDGSSPDSPDVASAPTTDAEKRQLSDHRASWKLALAAGLVAVVAAATIVVAANGQPDVPYEPSPTAISTTSVGLVVPTITKLPNTPTVSPTPPSASGVIVSSTSTSIPEKSPTAGPRASVESLLGVTRRTLRNAFGAPIARATDSDTFSTAVALLTPTGYVQSITINSEVSTDSGADELLDWIDTQRPGDARLLETAWPEPGILRRTYVSHQLFQRSTTIGLPLSVDPSRLTETIEYNVRDGRVVAVTVEYGPGTGD